MYPSTIHVNKVNATFVDITIAIDRYVVAGMTRKTVAIDNSSCEGACKWWTWEAGKDYYVMAHEEPAYIPSYLKSSAGWAENCHHIELPATRNLSIEFGKMKKMKLPCCGDEEFYQREFTVYYSLSVPDGDLLRRAIK